MTRKFNTLLIVRIAVLSALAFVLQFIALPILPYAPFLKLDFADVPVILAGFAIHPIAGIVVSLVKNLLQLPFSGTFLVGELSNFLQGTTYVLVSCLIYRNHKSRKQVLIASLVAILAVTIVGVLSNYFIMLPTYGKLFGIPQELFMKLIFTAIIPFNLIKFTAESIVVILLYKRIARPLLKGRSR